MSEPLLFEISKKNRTGFTLPELDIPEKSLSDFFPSEVCRAEEPDLPEISESVVIRHFIHLSNLNHHVDRGFYPLGSCTMKYNPKINDKLSSLPGFSEIHPLQDEKDIYGAIQIMGELSDYLKTISGLDGITLQPSAGSQGELTGIKIMRAYHEDRGNPRKIILIPDSAHGTNPANVTVSGYNLVQVKSNENGLVDIDDLKEKLNKDVAGFMVTNPSTLGLFEKEIKQIAKLVHESGALLYMDGANLNALLGIVRPGDIGFDLVHFNLHKTFSTPHGGGGPGSGPVGVISSLTDYLPVPVISKKGNTYQLNYKNPKSMGRIHEFFGNFNVMVKAYVYIRMLGSPGLKRVSKNAIINANYLMRKLEKYYLLPYKQHAMHEFVLSGDWQKEKGVKTLDIAKHLLDFGIHAPTVYFPLIVHEALMIEPTETESIEELDKFIDAMIKIAEETENNPERVKAAPTKTPVSRLNEGIAARNLDVKFDKDS
ncbi:MAG: aminomethyl-transferring glycine dehydrogenase subunit GcvPB [bacterium]